NRGKEAASVAFRPQTRIQNGQHAAIAPVANETAEPLLQREDRQRHLIVLERFSTARADGVDTGRRDRVARRREWQLVDDDAAQRLADDVDALPEARCGEQHGMRGLAEL